ncbi:MAG: FAD-dependent pyridine nucleotide-disulfide oxidoreductase [Conexibacter sp.]|nr:FAD-dependent pyridine nucleotide-disulfide oxidoreductase [Conexibacter sp.]
MQTYAATMTDLAAAPDPHIVIAGGGVAAIETLLALRALPGGASLAITVIAPTPFLTYRPLATVERFGAPRARRYALDAICRDFDATQRNDALRRVDIEQHVAITARGERVPYDTLVVATGARHPSLENANTFLADDACSLNWLQPQLQRGAIRRIAFVVPGSTGWSLPIYELALLTAARARELGQLDLAVALVTPEEVPLAAFHGDGSAAVAELLREAGIKLLTSSYARDYDGTTLTLTPGDRTLAADRVITLPRLKGPAIEGLPADKDDFVHADQDGHVPGVDDVYAIGDAATFAIKQGGLAAQQADRVAATIARARGAAVREPSARPVLRAILMTGAQPLYLRATISGGESVASSASRECPWWPPHKIAARHLAPYLADRSELDPSTAHQRAVAYSLAGDPAVVHAEPADGGIELLGRDG